MPSFLPGEVENLLRIVAPWVEFWFFLDLLISIPGDSFFALGDRLLGDMFQEKERPAWVGKKKRVSFWRSWLVSAFALALVTFLISRLGFEHFWAEFGFDERGGLLLCLLAPLGVVGFLTFAAFLVVKILEIGFSVELWSEVLNPTVQEVLTEAGHTLKPSEWVDRYGDILTTESVRNEDFFVSFNSIDGTWQLVWPRRIRWKHPELDYPHNEGYFAYKVKLATPLLDSFLVQGGSTIRTKDRSANELRNALLTAHEDCGPKHCMEPYNEQNQEYPR